MQRGALLLVLASTVFATLGCAASAVIGVGGLAVDAAVGAVRIGGEVVGAGADMLLGSDGGAL